MKTLLTALLLATLGTAAAKADSITVTFDHPNQNALPGATVQFFGTIFNNTASTIFLNSDDLNLNGLSFFVNDQFFSTVPISLAAGANSGDIELFDITVTNPLSDAAGKYTGVYDLLGGPNADAQNVLETIATFSVNTAPVTSPVPEPSTLCLLLTGASTLLPLARRKLKSRS